VQGQQPGSPPQTLGNWQPAADNNSHADIIIITCVHIIISTIPASPVARPAAGLTKRVVPEFSNDKCQAVSHLRQTVLARQMVSGTTPHKLAYADTEGTMEVLTRTGCVYGVRKKHGAGGV
jgi:hypothetical protein